MDGLDRPRQYPIGAASLETGEYEVRERRGEDTCNAATEVACAGRYRGSRSSRARGEIHTRAGRTYRVCVSYREPATRIRHVVPKRGPHEPG
jgi:hypothetical protein